MGFYLRKSLRVGPLRFNLSGSGIGVSAGIPGFRVGTGPRGHYVRIGSGLVKYRATLPADPRGRAADPPTAAEQQIPPGTHAPLEDIESAHYSQIVDSSSRELLDELNRKRQMVRWWPIVSVGLLLVLIWGYSAAWPVWLMVPGLVASIALVIATSFYDALRKTVVLFYDFDLPMETAYDRLHDAAAQLAGCTAAWHIAASGRVYDPKYHAGAGSLVKRNRTFVRKAKPPYFETNIETIAVGVGRQTLHFFPDRVLIYDANGVGAVGYRELDVRVSRARFIEDGSVPADAQVVDRTWKYVNRSGGPDRRFKDNRQIPICLYEELAFSSPTGLNEVVQLSRCGFGDGLAKAVASLGQVLPLS